MRKVQIFFAKALIILSVLLVDILGYYFSNEKNAFDFTFNHTYFPGSMFVFCLLSFFVFLKIDMANWKNNSLLGKPFLRSEINWRKEYKKHLKDKNAAIPFSPISGKNECSCLFCFYRDGKNNPDRDCRMKNNEAKIFFGYLKEDFLPPTIYNKEVGYYCPYWKFFLTE